MNNAFDDENILLGSFGSQQSGTFLFLGLKYKRYLISVTFQGWHLHLQLHFELHHELL